MALQFNLAKNSEDNTEWWELKEMVQPEKGEKSSKDNITIISFNERVAPGALSFLTSYGWVTSVHNTSFYPIVSPCTCTLVSASLCSLPTLLLGMKWKGRTVGFRGFQADKTMLLSFGLHVFRLFASHVPRLLSVAGLSRCSRTHRGWIKHQCRLVRSIFMYPVVDSFGRNCHVFNYLMLTIDLRSLILFSSL